MQPFFVIDEGYVPSIAVYFLFFGVDFVSTLATTGTLSSIQFLHDICPKWLPFAAYHIHFAVLLTSQAVSAQAEDLLAAEALQSEARAASSPPMTGDEESSKTMAFLWAEKDALVTSNCPRIHFSCLEPVSCVTFATGDC